MHPIPTFAIACASIWLALIFTNLIRLAAMVLL